MNQTSSIEDLIYNRITQSELMQRYADFFDVIFKPHLVSFGYEKIYHNGFYEGLSNLPEIAELFLETKAYTNLKNVFEDYLDMKYGLIHLNTLSRRYQAYVAFRKALNKRFKIHTSFYMLEQCPHYYNVFVWNFCAPPKGILHQEQDLAILLSFLNNEAGIQYVIENFKLLYRHTLSKKVKPIKAFDTPFKQPENKLMEQKLIELNHLKKEDLNLKTLDLSEKEAVFLSLYLKGLTNKEIAAKMFLSIRTIEDYLRHIREKLNVKLRSEIYAGMAKLALWKKLV